ncbi:cryptochrome/photolyase family protein [Actinokineospora pegani]|uniref:cryptochrome/photolyase family protein n=1 Tax=Actinokineospora pegani TaxID=2654637 RepID=UPI0012E9D2AD|nr:deoxyribodipyrimidine photo-lyase [Actinokineospora pegani]
MAESPSVVWFRRDLRLGDHPALLTAADRNPRAVALFVLDDALREPSGAARLTFMYRCLRALDSQLGGRLHVVRGNPEEVVPRVAAAFGAGSVHVSTDCGPYGRGRDERVAEALGDVEFVRSGSPYAVTPGRVTKDDGEPFKVFTPFSRVWARHGWRKPADTSASTVEWVDPSAGTGGPERVQIPDDPACGASLPEAGEQAALEHWESFLEGPLHSYKRDRDKPGLDGTSRMSAYLRWGCVHPRTLLADLAEHSGEGPDTYRTELAWRDFYADVLWHRPETARHNHNPRFDQIQYDTGPDADDRFDAWCRGETGFPIVDAGMRQLLAEGWMHNRVRMIVASFLAKDLHLPWWLGARHFMTHLVDGDLASNQHGWQWTAGSGTDAAPYFRVFNPVTQGEKFDPEGTYVRRYVPELAGVQGKKVHQPQDNPPKGYPAPIVDHAHERQVALNRYGQIKA